MSISSYDASVLASQACRLRERLSGSPARPGFQRLLSRVESEEMASLSSQVSAEVLDAMRQLVDTVIRGMGGDVAIKDGYDILTEVPSGTLAQLCMWQLVVGYNLREMEAREELNKQLSAGEDDESPDSPSAGDGAGAGGK